MTFNKTEWQRQYRKTGKGAEALKKQNTKYNLENRAKIRERRVIRARMIKKKLVEFRGGKCERCGYDRCIQALQFHHRNPAEKDNLLKDCRIDRWVEEIKKCDMLCSNCHVEEHEKQRVRVNRLTDNFKYQQFFNKVGK